MTEAASELDELRKWKASAMEQLGKADAIKELLPPQYLGWDIYDATVDYLKRLRSQPFAGQEFVSLGTSAGFPDPVAPKGKP